MKKFFIACLSALMSMGITATAAGSHILMINGEPVEKTVTKIHFEGDNVVLHFGEDTESHDMNVVSFSFSNTTGVTDAQMFTFNGYISGNTVIVSGVAPGTTVSVYSISGVMVASADTNSDGEVTLDVNHLDAGVYVLVAGKNVVKFVKH